MFTFFLSPSVSLCLPISLSWHYWVRDCTIFEAVQAHYRSTPLTVSPTLKRLPSHSETFPTRHAAVARIKSQLGGRRKRENHRRSSCQKSEAVHSSGTAHQTNKTGSFSWSAINTLAFILVVEFQPFDVKVLSNKCLTATNQV